MRTPWWCRWKVTQRAWLRLPWWAKTAVWTVCYDWRPAERARQRRIREWWGDE
jgi:hypothetical protein